jgi:hypothetical protein
MILINFNIFYHEKDIIFIKESFFDSIFVDNLKF